MSDGFSFSEQCEAEQCICGHARKYHGRGGCLSNSYSGELARPCMCNDFREPPRAAATRNVEIDRLRTELAALRDKARRFKGWRVRYEWRHRPGYEWVACFDWAPSKSGAHSFARRYRRDTDHFRSVSVVRVYGKRREAGEG